MEKENWEEEFDKICFYEDRASIFETTTPENPPIIKRLNAEHLGDVEYELIPQIKSFIRQLLREEREKQYDKVVQILEKILGYCGIWHEDDIISVERKTGHGVSMTIKTFLELLKEEMVENKKVAKNN